MRILLLVLVLAIPSFPQWLIVGVRAGIRTLPDRDPNLGTSQSKPYLIGPMVELRLPYGFGFEADALHSGFGYDYSVAMIGRGLFTQRVCANSWEFPLLLKYRLPVPYMQPYVLAGVGSRYTSAASYGTAREHARIVGGGFEWGRDGVRIAPEVRYLWRKQSLTFLGDPPFFLPIRQNEVQVLVGIGWSWKKS